ncbi:hypothetical protein CHARACLAT_022490 [Characodon lateralis]|uniref:Uncharacterized protein n=1 Tax=Characodon lateralis TaxID=208331 RepID=A0ABU7E6S9_9TELE|nr:hypothetical protein [Characodon lateralis]
MLSGRVDHYPGFTSFTFGQKPRTSSTGCLCKHQLSSSLPALQLSLGAHFLTLRIAGPQVVPKTLPRDQLPGDCKPESLESTTRDCTVFLEIIKLLKLASVLE